MQNLILKRDEEYAWITWIKKRIDNNLNFLALFTGPTGSGKTWSTLSVSYMIDPEFDPKEQLAFNFTGLMRAINKCNDRESVLGRKKYKVLIFDESQTSVNKRDWQSKVNKLFLYLLSTFRHQNIIVLFNSPYSDFLDSATMKLIHAEFQVRGWDRKTKMAHINPKLLQYNGKMQKFYEHRLYVMHRGQKGAGKIKYWFIPKPPKHIIDPYEDMKNAFTSKLNEQITKELRIITLKEEASLVDEPVDSLNMKTIQPAIWEEASKGFTYQKDIADRITAKTGRDINSSVMSHHIKSMKKKGWNVDKFYVAPEKD